MQHLRLIVWLFMLFLISSCEEKSTYDIIIKNGMVYDGNGSEPQKADIAIIADTIAFIGDLSGQSGTKQTIDANGLMISPGFVNMLSWSTESLIQDGRSLGEIKQGVTLEVMGEGDTMGPLSDSVKAYAQRLQGDIKYKIEWTTLGEYLNYLEKRGVSTNVASFVGAAGVVSIPKHGF